MADIALRDKTNQLSNTARVWAVAAGEATPPPRAQHQLAVTAAAAAAYRQPLALTLSVNRTSIDTCKTMATSWPWTWSQTAAAVDPLQHQHPATEVALRMSGTNGRAAGKQRAEGAESAGGSSGPFGAPASRNSNRPQNIRQNRQGSGKQPAAGANSAGGSSGPPAARAPRNSPQPQNVRHNRQGSSKQSAAEAASVIQLRAVEAVCSHISDSCQMDGCPYPLPEPPPREAVAARGRRPRRAPA